MLDMFIRSLAENEFIVQVHDNISPQLFAAKSAHQLLEGPRCITQAKAHDFEIVMTVWGCKTCLEPLQQS